MAITTRDEYNAAIAGLLFRAFAANTRVDEVRKREGDYRRLLGLLQSAILDRDDIEAFEMFSGALADTYGLSTRQEFLRAFLSSAGVDDRTLVKREPPA